MALGTHITLSANQLGHRVTAVTPLENHCLALLFDGKEQRVLDLAAFIRPGTAFEGIGRDQGLFRSVFIRGRTVEWPDGATLDPDVMYHFSNPI